MTTEEVKDALRHMSVAERCEVLKWLVEMDDDAWDKQIENDANSGRFNKIFAQIDNEPKFVLLPLDGDRTYLQVASEIEDYVANLVAGTKTKLRSAYDLVSVGGVRFDVKWSRLSRPKGGGGGTRDWTWAICWGSMEPRYLID